ncbi:MAG: endolytic transglycosylase MltG [Gammaproteobacteria bacterium]|nr:endolytic transglycosylase MltG [Gammaproteobacteria bacterium]MCY4211332.1 endolytic transglycosylase MltG [Gammaproteobacteria bacterium]MCY4282076.1 endolytic transglycosylase MltG [Gammaproteobacteria bacterium]MCY4337514.1 endolytic transglycosylase MltG [Gammaproteobacteria bacterium]
MTYFRTALPRIKWRLLFIPVVIIALAGWWLYQDVRTQLDTPLNLDSPAQFVIAPGMPLRAVAEEMAARGWFEHPRYLQLEGRLRGVETSIKAGEYLLEPGVTALSLLDMIVAGRVAQHALTIPEGWTFRQIINALHAHPHLKRTLHSTTPARVMLEIGYPGYAAEGRFFPDTYYFPAGSSDRDFLRRALKRMETVLNEEWETRAPGLPYRSSYQALIMASLIEKETAVPEERELVAGVFVRRLEQNMKLQTDPTVIYALGDSFDGDLRRRDLKLDSPFNTYRYRGLPPTPIAAAGRAAIRAALHPAPGESLYFVATGDNGGHHFSRSLAEHNQAVAKYQLNDADEH